MTIEELDLAVLTRSLPELGLQAGDVGTVVLIHNGGAGYEVEFMTGDGNTVDVTTLTADEVRLIAPKEILHVRDTRGRAS